MPVNWSDLEYAFCEANSGPLGAAWIHRERSEVITADELVDSHEPPPADDSAWIGLPSAETLNLKRALAIGFVDERCPLLGEDVRRCFTQRGAWATFSELMDRNGHLDEWRAYEHAAREQALMTWAAEHGVTVVR